MCLKTITSIFSSFPVIWKIIKIVLIAIILWLVLSYLNKEVGLFSWVTYFFKLIATGVQKVFKILTLQIF